MVNIIKTNFTFKSNMVKRNFNKLSLIILHHRGGDGDVQSIHQQHLKNGWAGIGYHFYIRKDGSIYQGRPIEYVGSHCPNNNSSSIGICLEGHFGKVLPTGKQIDSMNELIKDLRTKYKQIKRVLNHKDLYATACPVIDLKTLVK